MSVTLSPCSAFQKLGDVYFDVTGIIIMLLLSLIIWFFFPPSVIV